MTAAREAVLRLFKVDHNRTAVFEPLPAIFSGHVAPVVRPTADGDRELVPMSWGFVLLSSPWSRRQAVCGALILPDQQRLVRRGVTERSGLADGRRAELLDRARDWDRVRDDCPSG